MTPLDHQESAAIRFDLDPAVCSEPGTHATNEDAAVVATANGHWMLALADGLGGHQRGEVASRLAVARAVELFQAAPSVEAPALAALIRGAHRALKETRPDSAENDLRTTLILLISDGVTARWAHVGDSRLYLFQGGTIAARTRDHSVPEMLHRAGEISDDEIRRHPDRGRLIQALGQESEPRAAVSDAHVLQAGEAFLLCSDGWWETVSDREMERSLEASAGPQEWLEQMAAAITAAAHDPQDNYTAAATFVAATHRR